MTRIQISKEDREVLDSLGIEIGPGMELLAGRYIALGKVLNALSKLETDDSLWVLAEARKAVNSQGEVIENTVTDDGTVYPIGIIIDTVAREFRFTKNDLLSAARNNELARARQVAMYFLRLQNAYSLSGIGAALGGRSAATVSHGFMTIAKIVENPRSLTDKWILNKIENIKRYLR
jgi:chromosomal replication initiation ATPase DnaA